MSILGVLHVASAALRDEVPDVVEERGDDDLIVHSPLFGESGRLQHVLGQGQGFSQIGPGALALEGFCNPGHEVAWSQPGGIERNHGVSFESPADRAAKVDRIPSLSA